MSIEVILKAAEYIERRERGEQHKFSVFWTFPLRLASRTSAEKILGLTKTWRADGPDDWPGRLADLNLL